DLKAIMRLLADYRSRQTYTAKLLQAGYPIVVSNRTDPFARVHWRQSLALLETLATMGFQVAVQTKGGPGAHEAAAMLPPSVWYVTVTTDDPDVLRRVEPGASGYPERRALIEDLLAHNHQVVVGVNPLVAEWLPSPETLFTTLARLGVWGVWIERLHLNYRQIGAFKPWQHEALGEPLIARARRRSLAPGDMAHVMGARAMAQACGLEVFSVGQPTYSRFWEVWEDTYAKTFPTAQGWVNHCYEQGWAGSRLITFDDFSAYFAQRLPEGRMGIDSYLGAVAHNLWWTHQVPPRLTFQELLGIIWTEPRSRNCPARMPCFAMAGRHEADDSWTLYVDELKMPYMVFDPDGFDSYYTHLELEPAEPATSPAYPGQEEGLEQVPAPEAAWPETKAAPAS
ncbi:MAG: hypothetical protein GX649_18205, partial [Chloroflexi bacterium]|nr:hypothetical protein [Chloroflexota bacterium]